MCQYNPLENGCYHNNTQHVHTSKYTLTFSDDRTEAKILSIVGTTARFGYSVRKKIIEIYYKGVLFHGFF